MEGAFMAALGGMGKALADKAGVIKDYAITAKDWGIGSVKDLSESLDKAGESFMKGYNREEEEAKRLGEHLGQDPFGLGLKEEFDLEKTQKMFDEGVTSGAKDYTPKPDFSIKDEDKKKKGGIYGALAKAMMNEDVDAKSSKDYGPPPPGLMSGRGPSIRQGGPVSGGELGRGKVTARDFLGNRFK